MNIITTVAARVLRPARNLGAEAMVVTAHPGGAALAMIGRYLALLLSANLAEAVLPCTMGEGIIGTTNLGAA